MKIARPGGIWMEIGERTDASWVAGVIQALAAVGDYAGVDRRDRAFVKTGATDLRLAFCNDWYIARFY